SVPFYVICTSEKFLPAGYVPPAEPPKAASELAVNPQEPIRVENFYFDHTPLERVTGFITESGVLSSDQVRQRLSAQRLPAK
ncbi:MAG: initiation factor 2B, partial [bacterium]|nr:initiation factor 2B [bacterium]